MLLYYDASNDSYPVNTIEKATLFKRRTVANAVRTQLGDHQCLMKVKIRRDGSIRRVTLIRDVLAESKRRMRRHRDEGRLKRTRRT
jgi:hypothetical protein